MSYEVAIASDPEVTSIEDDRRQRAVIALFDLHQMHLSEFTDEGAESVASDTGISTPTLGVTP